MLLRINYLVSFCLFFLLIQVSKADHRNFVWTYEYMTLAPGTAELENYTTFETSNSDDFENSTTTKLNLEYEIGMTNHFDFAIYQNFKQSPGSTLKYDGFKLRARYKIGKENDFFLDPLIYLEYANTAGFANHVIEPKLILAKNFGDFRLSLNPYCEIEKEDDEWEFVPKYAVGFGYEVSHLFNVGIEAKGDKDGNYIGPTISHGMPHAWFALGALTKLGEVTSGKPEFQIRMILGFEL